MYLYKINLTDGNSYIVQSKEGDLNKFLESIYLSDVYTFDLIQQKKYSSNFITKNVAISIDKIVSIEC